MMKKFITFFTICYLGGVSLIKAQISPFVAGRLQFTLDSVCAKYKIKGASAAVLIPNMGIWKGVYGLSYEGKPINSNMLFGMGSNTKTHISATLLKMQELNLISLDDTIGKWIVGYPNISGQITIRQCLSHTSGIYDYMRNAAINDSVDNNPSKIWQSNDILKLVLAPLFQPGRGFNYSNTNYIVAGFIIQSVLSKSPFRALNEYILQPNNLLQTFYFGEQPKTFEYAHPWTVLLTGDVMTDLTTTPVIDNLFSLANTAGGLITTAEENVQFWHKLFSKEIINASSWKQMTTMVKTGQTFEYGLGIFRSKNTNGRIVYSHGGTFFGYINENMIDTLTGQCYSIFTNQDSVNNDGLKALVLGPLQKIVINMPPAGINEQANHINNLLVYPNPASENISIQKDNFNGTVFITDILGNVVYTNHSISTHININTAELLSGVYFIMLKSNDGKNSYSSKIQIVH